MTSKETFREQFSNFIADTEYYADAWDESLFGVISAYFEDKLVTLCVRLINSDLQVRKEEVDTVNEIFGAGYNIRNIKEMLENCSEDLSYFESSILEDLDLLDDTDENLAEEYADLISSLCDAVAEAKGDSGSGDDWDLEYIRNVLEQYN